MGPLRALAEWFDSRTNISSARKHLLDEELPPGTRWWFVTGSILMLLLSTQLLSGIVLAMYYVPSPEYAYDSVRFIMDKLSFGSVLRGLHFFGASLIVIAAGVHMMRVVLLGSYKKPREVTWLSGMVLFLVILGFALSGYLLPWDQRAYWATTVTINIARGTPFIGEQVASVMRGGLQLGALTLLRWYAAHVFLLPAALIALTASHLYLMRYHGISGPVKPQPGKPQPFYPYQALRDSFVVAVVFAILVTLAWKFPPSLDAVADPSDATYIPRPEWYFLSLFQMLKYFPGPLEPVATMVIPGVVVGGLMLLPFLDRSPHRELTKRPLVMIGFAVLLLGVATLTTLGLRDTPTNADPHGWSPLSIAGQTFSQDERCVTCHKTGGAGSPLDQTVLRKDPEWLISHVRDPQVIAPGVRDVPPGGMSTAQGQAVLAYMKRVRAGADAMTVSASTRDAAVVFARFCSNCHQIQGEGGTSAPALDRVGGEHDAKWLRDWISDPTMIKPESNMPAFGERLTPEQMDAIVADLAARK